MPRASKAACCERGEKECATGSPIKPTLCTDTGTDGTGCIFSVYLCTGCLDMYVFFRARVRPGLAHHFAGARGCAKADPYKPPAGARGCAKADPYRPHWMKRIG